MTAPAAGRREAAPPSHVQRQAGTVRCTCGWSFDGLILEGAAAAREHRRDAHPERPEVSEAQWKNSPPPRPKRGTAAERKRRERAECRGRLLALLRRSGGEPVALAELAAATGISGQRVGVTLDWMRRGGEPVEKAPRTQKRGAGVAWRYREASPSA